VKPPLAKLLAILFIMPAPLAAQATSPGAPRIFLFASPATEESLTDAQAQAHLASFRQTNATAVADRAACSLTHSVEIASALGVYETSSENSFVLEAKLDRKPSEYLAALTGLYSRQEFILLFFEDAKGADELWTIETRQSLEPVIAALRKWKLTPVTIRPEKDRNEIWFMDSAGKRAEDLMRFTSDVNGHASQHAGAEELLGNPDRAVAVQAWRKQIRAFEQSSSGPRLSERLASKSWKTAKQVHTCSREMPLFEEAF
jgi:hypothetical protein